jgi:anaerobic selenocysteine-containing dehydrogenase
MAKRNVNDPASQQRMLGTVPGAEALGRGPRPSDDYSRHEYDHPAAGWGAARSVARVLERAGEPIDGFRALLVMNHEDGGFDCPGCAWPDDPSGLRLDIREPHGVRIAQAARQREFLTPSGRAEFALAPLPDHVDPGEGRLLLTTIRSHDQFNTTIYTNDDRYRGFKGLRTVVLMHEDDMRDRGLGEFDLVDMTSISCDGSRRTVHGYRAVAFEIPRGCAAGYMPELNVLCGIADYSTQSDQPVIKRLVVEVRAAK